MGIKANITATDFPAQGLMAGKRVRVCFHHDMSRPVEGVVLRDDTEGAISHHHPSVRRPGSARYRVPVSTAVTAN